MVIVTLAKMLRRPALVIVLIGSLTATVPAQPPPADLAVLDARILTVDASFRTVAALAVRNGRFVAVGSNDEVRRHIGSTTRVIDGRGRTVVPGFIDTHVHALDVATAEATQPFVNLRSIEEVQNWLRKEAPRRPQGSWIWTPRAFPTRLREHRFPTRQELDAAAPDHPVVVDSAYAFSLNTAALRAAGITRESPNPTGGAIVKDAAGEPTGLLRNAGALLARFRPTPAGIPLETLERVHQQYLAAGITSVIERGATVQGFETYRRLKDAGRLRVRATVTIRVPDAADASRVERFVQGLPFRFGEGDEWLKAGPLKIVADGGILIGTSFMRKPFGRGGRELYAIDNPADRGFLTLTPEQIAAAIGIIHRSGWQMVAHVTGDAGVDVVLDGIEAAQKQTPGARNNDRRHTVIHGYFANQDSASRAARLGVLVDTQPAWHYKDGTALAAALGADRLAHFIGLKTLRRAGVEVAINTDHMFGLDANDAMNPFNPLLTIYAATTRRTESGRVLGADEAVTRQEALRMMTSAAAKFSFDEKDRGSIETGKLGDFVVLNDHLLTVPAERLRTMRADMTVVAGRVAFDVEKPGAQADDRPGEWRSYGRDPGGSRYSPLTQITRDNVDRLTQTWSYHHGEPLPAAGREGPAFESTPLVVGDFLYFTSPSGRVIALDPETGAERWTFDPKLARPAGAARHRGVAYWEGGSDRRIFAGTLDGRLVALDAVSGKPKPEFGENGAIRLAPDLSLRSPPAIYRDLVITGAAAPEFPGMGPAGDVRAFDVRTGRQVWEFHTVPRANEAGNETWEQDSWRGRTGANVWSMIAVDDARGLVFLPIGSASYDFYGGDRKGQNLYANSVVALDAATGRLRWHYQTVHHDLWDYDLPAQPVLVSVHNGRRVDAVAQVGKTGFVYLLDRETGRPLFPIDERSVPASTVPGEAAWPTQPFPTKPPPLARIAPLTREDLSQVTPESRQSCAALFDRVVSGGIFTPHGERLTLVFPGNLGGATWSGAAFDPNSGYLFVNANELGAIGEMRKAAGAIAYRRASDLPRGEYARFWDERRWPCQKPPWGTLTAVNLHDGSIAWRVPLGIVDALAANGIRDTGAPNLGGAIVTAGGLVFIAGTNDRRMRAFDTRTGAVVWETTLPASGHATPMTYLGPRSGRQFIAIAAGGGGYLSPTYSDALVAFSLPAHDARPSRR